MGSSFESIPVSASIQYVGIDNGVDGGICILAPDRSILAYRVMPIQKARRGSQLDVLVLDAWFSAHVQDPRHLHVVVEEPGGSKSARSARVMDGVFHAIRTWITLRQIRWTPITPSKWQKVLLPGVQTGQTKPAALTRARALWPGVDFLATERSRVPHDGLVDASLIAEYGRLSNL